MPVKKEAYLAISEALSAKNITLVAVSKTKPVEDILALYELGQRDFGENYVQELTEKARQLPADINWHFIGHLQTNKVKLIVPIVQLIQGVDSLKLLQAIDLAAGKAGKRVNCLLQMHISQEDTKFGFDESEIHDALKNSMNMSNVNIQGLMGMASFTNDMEQVKKEFRRLSTVFLNINHKTSGVKLTTLSMGMSADYQLAITEGSNMVRIGSLIFGER